MNLNFSLIHEATAFACYRLPGAKAAVYVEAGHAEGFPSIDEATGEASFVIAPFQITASTPVVRILPERTQEIPLPHILDGDDGNHEPACSYEVIGEAEERKAYGHGFRQVKDALRQGMARKVVLSRRMRLQLDKNTPIHPFQLFGKACRLYPHNYVALFSTPQTGMWLIATPECLLEQVTSRLWRTMALAGTMTWEAGSPTGAHAYWSHKDRTEQKLVADYIHDRILPFAEQLEISHTYPVRAGSLAHLRTDFSFTLQDESAGQLLSALHPTPAVCGLPLQSSRQIIAQAESSPRRYYAGFSGPWKLQESTRLYVSLRCMEMTGDSSVRTATLYAGGGILNDSTEGAEWLETERKCQTMLNLLATPT